MLKYSSAVLVCLMVLAAAFIFPQTSLAQTLQRMEITQVSAPAQGVAVFRDYPDHAAVIIESPITTLRFDSNVDGIVREMHEPERGRYILILEPFTQILVIDAPGFMQQRQRIGNPQAREVQYFEIVPETQTSDLISVIFNVAPEDARLFVDGQETAVNETVQIAPGNAELRIEKEGYRVIEDVVEINERNIQFNYRLEEIDIVAVQFVSNVEGASITIDGTVRGNIDRGGGLGLFLFPGSYAVSVSHTGYVSQSGSVEVTEQGQNRFSFDLVRNIGELVLTLNPADAQVQLNRQDYTGQSVIELAPGRYRLEVERDGYDPHSESVEIVINERISRKIALQAQTGSLQFSVTPSNANVKLIDASQNVVQEWTGIQLLRNLKVGSYTLRTTAEGHIPDEQTIHIVKDEMLQIALELSEGAMCGQPITDIDGNSYNTVQIGNQCWMSENLNTSRYRDGSRIPNVTDNREWTRLNSGAWSYYDNNASNGRTYGKLYNWYAVADRRGLCPEGWRVPSDEDWTVLENHLGGRDVAGVKLKSTGTKDWRSPNSGATNESGFLALPGGWRNNNFGTFNSLGSFGYWWSSSEFFSNNAFSRRLNHSSASVDHDGFSKRSGFSVRCIGD